MEPYKSQAKNVERFSIIQLANGKVAMFERKSMTAIYFNEDNNCSSLSTKLKGDTEVTVLKTPAILALEYLEQQYEPLNLSSI